MQLHRWPVQAPLRWVERIYHKVICLKEADKGGRSAAQGSRSSSPRKSARVRALANYSADGIQQRNYTVTQLGKEHAMNHLERQPTVRLLYTGKTHTAGGREHGVSRSSDGHLDIKLSTPGTAGIGTNPEQLFAAGWSACFEGAMGLAAHKRKLKLPEDLAIDAEV